MTLLVMTTGMTGMMTFRYHCVHRTENAKKMILASYSGHMIAELWTGCNGDPAFDLTSYTFSPDIQVEISSTSGSSVPSHFTETGCYSLLLDNHNLIVTLAYQDSEMIANTRNLYICLSWEDHKGNVQKFILTTITQANITSG